VNLAPLLNAARLQGQRAMAEFTTSRLGEITNYDPDNYTARVTLQPDGLKTGWLPIASQWVGDGWGCFSPPNIGDMCSVEFINGDLNAGFVEGKFWNNDSRPVSVQSGEYWLIHAKGAFFKLTNDGKATFSDGQGATVSLNGDGTISSAASTWTHTGKLTVTQDIEAGGNISDQNGAKGNMQHIRDQHNAHAHTGVQTGGGTSAGPTATL
jgi:phage baseplate assembly protein V